ncbi:MAG: hypothetical protein Q9207_005688, partial [Kuettlingeria erythrocarpa]
MSSAASPMVNANGVHHTEQLIQDAAPTVDTGASMPIAIVGLSCRYAGEATSPEKLWQLCLDGKGAWSEVPSNRFNQKAFYHPSGEKYTTTMDPQCRLQLESVFEALESAGMPLEKVAGTATGVYAGLFFRDYLDSFARDPESFPRLRSGETKMAIVGGVNVMLNPDYFILLSSLGFLSPDGKCYAFDDRASGYARGEGVGTLIIKPLADAVRDNDPIRAIIRGTAVNQNGRTDTITSPDVDAQEAVIRECYRNAGLDPSRTGYVEAHGTGTQAGDPVECEGIARVLTSGRSSSQMLHIGSVKTNLGHTEAASGLAALIKAIYALEHAVIPPSINFEKPNEKTKLRERRLQIPSRAIPWPAAYEKRVSINNFGYGGTNTHVILDSPEAHKHRQARDQALEGRRYQREGSRWRTFILSANDELTIKRTTTSMLAFLKNALGQGKDEDGSFFADLAYTLCQRRSSFPWSIAVSASNQQGLIESLESSHLRPAFASRKPRIGFVFTGQGAQWYAMGRELLGAYPLFAESIDEADGILREFGCPWSLTDELTKSKEISRINEIKISPPLCLAVQISLVRLLRSWGVDCVATTGHSSGEVAAAYAANALDYRSALAIVYLRGVLTTGQVEKMTGRGAMMAVGLGRDEAEPYISDLASGKAVIACVNSQSSVTISGDEEAIEAAGERLQADGVFARRLLIKAAFHSHHMQPIAKAYKDSLNEFMVQKGDFHGMIYSSPVTGQRIADAAEIVTPEYWVRNMVQPVEFADCFWNMCFDNQGKTSVDMVVEIGPHGALAGPMRQILSQIRAAGKHDIAIATCLVRNQDAVKTMHELACQLIHKGYKLDMAAVNFASQQSQRPKVLPNLPSYPWNHQTKHWSESRLNRRHRFRREQGHDLLGSPALGCDPSRPIWRRILRATDVPWVFDHVVQGDVVYPAAGFICMAIEAVSQLSRRRGWVTSEFHLQHVEVSSALVVPDTSEGIEVQLSLVPFPQKGLDGYAFEISSVDLDDGWTKHCNGRIRAGREQRIQDVSSAQKATNQAPVYSRQIDSADVFRALRLNGITHGKTFQNIDAVQAGTNCSKVAFHIADTASVMPARFQSPHVIHPTTLDSIIVAAYTVLPIAALERQAARVPCFFKQLSISANVPAEVGHALEVRSILGMKSKRSFDATATVHDPANPSMGPVVEMQGLRCQSLEMGNDGKRFKKWCSKLEWRAAFSRMDKRQLRAMLGQPIYEQERQDLLEIKAATSCVIENTMRSLSQQEIASLEPHLLRLYRWMSAHVLKANAHLSSRSKVPNEPGELLEKVKVSSLHGQLISDLYTKLPEIMRGGLQPLSLILEHHFLDNVLGWRRCYAQVAQLISLYSFQRPRARYLEVGASTGGCTEHVLNVLGSKGPYGRQPLCSSYDFTDISAGFFEAARERFADWGDLVRYRTFDADADASQQGFEAEAYDVVIASHVLHATKNIRRTLDQLRRLLKPGGKLILAETTRDRPENQVVFGMLPGWWVSEEEERQGSPTLSTEAWEQHLTQAGYTGLDVEVSDCDNESFASSSVMMSTVTTTAATTTESASIPESVLILDSTHVTAPWIEELRSNIEKVTGQRPTTSSLQDIVPMSKAYIFLDEVFDPLLAKIDERGFQSLKGIVAKAKAIMWVSRGGTDRCEMPHMALHSGLLRVLRCEDFNGRFITMDVDPNRDASKIQTEAIADVFRTAIVEDQDDDVDSEYMERNGILHISRAKHAPEANRLMNYEYVEEPPSLQPFFQSGSTLRHDLNVHEAGEIVFASEPADTPSLPNSAIRTGWIEVKPQAFSLSCHQLQRSVITAFGCSGYIKKLGADFKGAFKTGDRVCALVEGPIGNSISVPVSSLVSLPDNMSFETAASIPLTFVTASYSILDVAHLSKGQRILIDGAASDIGQAALQISRSVGAQVFLIVETAEEADSLVKEWSIARDRIVVVDKHGSPLQWCPALSEEPVDVLMQCSHSALDPLMWQLVAPFGCVINLIGPGVEHEQSEALPISSNQTIYNVDIPAVARHKPHAFSRALQETMKMFQSGKLKPIVPLHIAAVGRLQDHLYRRERGEKVASTIIIKPTSEDQVLVRPSKQSAVFAADASYLIVGGFGGIGQSICQWMAARGAKNLILLSRNAEKSQRTADAFLQHLHSLGCRVMVESCDISDLESLKAALAKAAQILPPVRGDSIFANMSFADWRATTDAKVQGSWNLHLALQAAPLTFFTLLSSIVGAAGNAGQANYAAGNAFQDALARHRTARGLPGTAVDLGAVKSVGYLAEGGGEEGKRLSERFARLGFEMLDETDVLAVVEAAIVGDQQRQHGMPRGDEQTKEDEMREEE